MHPKYLVRYIFLTERPHPLSIRILYTELKTLGRLSWDELLYYVCTRRDVTSQVASQHFLV